jgi:Pyruvate/2-oxoacid:ferredoxin oxidoreductase delta subunit
MENSVLLHFASKIGCIFLTVQVQYCIRTVVTGTTSHSQYYRYCTGKLSGDYNNWDKMRGIPTIKFPHYSIWGYCSVWHFTIVFTSKINLNTFMIKFKVLQCTYCILFIPQPALNIVSVYEPYFLSFIDLEPDSTFKLS